MGKRERILSSILKSVEIIRLGKRLSHLDDWQRCIQAFEFERFAVRLSRLHSSFVYRQPYGVRPPLSSGPVTSGRVQGNSGAMSALPRILKILPSPAFTPRSLGGGQGIERKFADDRLFRSDVTRTGHFQGPSAQRYFKLARRQTAPHRILVAELSSKESAKDIDPGRPAASCNGESDEIVKPLESLDSKCQKLRSEFEAAKRGFQNVPAAIRTLPKMDPNGVYANYNLRLDQIKVYGFDYDYTLAHYTEALQPLIYDLATQHLVKVYRYPESCLNFKYDSDFPIRGLYYDKKHGNLLKLDFFHSVEPHGCFFGRRRLSRGELEEIYGGKHINVSDIPNLVPLMDLFCLSEACLISDVIQHFVDQNMEFDSAYVYDDVKRCIDYVHRSGLMHDSIMADPVKYLVKNKDVVKMLQFLKEKGKKLFILTNSPFPVVDRGMRYMFEGGGRSGDSWRELFDVVLASADKPTFYTSERPFRHYSTQTDMLGFGKVAYFGQHAVYYHGCLRAFLDITKWRGSEVLYCGDHLYTDLRGPAKAGWRTAAIIRELEREIMVQNELVYRIEQAKYNVIQELLGDYHKLPDDIQLGVEQQSLLLGLRRERQTSRIAMRAQFNQYFGSCFLTDTGKESAFAYNVQRYADIYTSRLENLIKSSSEPWLYTPYDLKCLPHHIKVPPSCFMNFE